MTLPDEPNLGAAEPAPRVRGFRHTPVLRDEVLATLLPAPGKLILDCTVGGGGHSESLLEAGAAVIGLDQDREALTFARGRLERFGAAFQAVHANFAEAGKALDALSIPRVDGALCDIGVSSYQLDNPERGFSFQADGDLDMRMNQEGLVTAASLVNTMSGEQLERVFRQYGEEPSARKIAARIVRDRMVQPFTRTLQLAEAIAAVSPRRGKAHPATRVFQALRIAVNRELEVLETGLEEITGRLAPGGRFAVITFHSLEDRLVKRFFKSRTEEWIDRPEWPERRRNPLHLFRRVTGKAVIASAVEQLSNPRSRSAKLRVVEKI